jgi:hypothetical protein|tara:strand:- start:2882 stop:3016 length:135 start_codon:yes stop_codon:yes gene_type:complete
LGIVGFIVGILGGWIIYSAIIVPIAKDKIIRKLADRAAEKRKSF